VAQLVKPPTLGFGSGHDVRVVGSSPKMGSCWVWCLLKILSPSFSLPPPHMCVLSLSQKKKKKKGAGKTEYSHAKKLSWIFT